MTDIAIEDLEEMLGSKGWAWLLGQFETHYGHSAVVAELRKIAKTAGEPNVKTDHVSRLLVLQEALEGFLSLPKKEINRQREALSQQRPTVHAGMQRGGL